MKAMILRHPASIEHRPLEIADIPTPDPLSEQILIRVKTCGVCHTDLHTVEGELPLPKLPLIPGHQVVGIIEKVGEDVTKYRSGQRVGVTWLYSTCGECQFCRADKENLCIQARFTGYHDDGGYAQYMVVSEDFAFPVPDDYTDEHVAPLLCGGVIGFRALRLSRVRAGERLGLWGFGASAHVVIQIAVHWGCQVFVFTRSVEHRRLAEELGASWVGGPSDAPPCRLHGAIIFAPVGELTLNALRVLERAGTVALAGIYMTPIPEIDYMELLYYERNIRSVTATTRKDAMDLLLVAPTVPVHTRVQTFPLEDANRALQSLKASRIKGSAVLQVP
ncbi:alcohol dehydrogenase [candidate division TA06 bacterium DG_26]|uniref:alcohol dehydrogenase n=1 Tax=candidate division TA06 bacterium DG_26 TaxID=1703771 RepID=A0A0S7WKN5_UNCT6|nr:MAG: alcohol dehydrogenase [candidate division TA06 bacterium DG_26]